MPITDTLDDLLVGSGTTTDIPDLLRYQHDGSLLITDGDEDGSTGRSRLAAHKNCCNGTLDATVPSCEPTGRSLEPTGHSESTTGIYYYTSGFLGIFAGIRCGIRSRSGLATGCMPPAFDNVPLGLLVLPSIPTARLRTRSDGVDARNGAAEKGIVEGWGACVPPLGPTHDVGTASFSFGFYLGNLLGLFCDFSAFASRNCVSRSFNKDDMPGFTGDIYASASWNGVSDVYLRNMLGLTGDIFAPASGNRVSEDGYLHNSGIFCGTTPIYFFAFQGTPASIPAKADVRLSVYNMPGLFSDFSASASRNCVSRSFNENGMPGFTGDIYAFAFWNGLLSVSIR